MDRINHSSAEADKFGAGKDGFTNGDPIDPGSGTVPQDAWFDGVQEELIKLIEDAGLTPSNGDYTQLKSALSLLYMDQSSPVAKAPISFTGLVDNVPRLSGLSTWTLGRRLLWQNLNSAADAGYRIYQNTNGDFEFVHGAVWIGGTGWAEESGASGVSGMVRITPKAGTAASISVHHNVVANSFTTRTDMGKRNVAAAWATVSNTLGAGFVEDDTENLSLISSSGTALNFEFDEDMADNKYAIFASRAMSTTGQAASTAQPSFVKTTTAFSLYPGGDGGPETFSSDEIIHVTVFGDRQ